MMSTFAVSTRLLAGFSLLLLVACKPQEPPKPASAPPLPRDEVLISPDSPKRGYIREAVVELTRRPLMDQVAATIAYDESKTVRVFSPISGRVSGSIAALGARLLQGAALAGLDSPDLGQAQADFLKAQADEKLAEHAFDRVRQLFDHGVAPRKDFEQASDDRERARSEAVRARLRLANLGVKAGTADNRFVLNAPIAGEVTERNINPGMEVHPDMDKPLFVLSDLSHLWVWMDVYEKDIGLIHSGQKVLLKVQAYPGVEFPASVDYISRLVDEDTHTVKVRCVLPNPEKKLLPAMYATVEVQSDLDDLGVVVPLSSLFTEGESDWLFVAIDHGRYQKRPVKVGLRLKDKAIIREGLQAGERLVVDGALLLRTEEDADAEAKP